MFFPTFPPRSRTGLRDGFSIMPAGGFSYAQTALPVKSAAATRNGRTFCCRTGLMALRKAATCVAARTARAPHGRKAPYIHVRPACAFVRLRRPKAPLREPFLPRPPDDARSALPIIAPACVLRGKRRARTPCPPGCRLPCGGWASFHGSLRSRLRRPRSCSTLFYIKARPESILTRRGLCRTTPLNTALFRAGAFQLRSGPPQTVPGLPAFRLRGRFRGWRARIRFPFVPAGSPGMRLPS